MKIKQPHFRLMAKAWSESLPISIGSVLSYLPYSARLGREYNRASAKILRYSELAPLARESMMFADCKRIVAHAFRNVPFYSRLYGENNFDPDRLHSFADWGKIPVVTKAALQSVPLEERVVANPSGFATNTGGTSGEPLDFVLDKQAFAREWAHIHFIWKAYGYRPNHLKLSFRGKHFRVTEPLRYNAAQHEYVVNAACPLNVVAAVLQALPEKQVIRWIHGYPSLVSEFAYGLAEFPALSSRLRAQLFGVLLGSEYPGEEYRSRIEATLSSNIVTWYGHSEMSVLAREASKGIYEALPSYGLAEAVKVSARDRVTYHLVGTSFYNHVHPFIRYDTGDLIQPLPSDPGTLQFQILEGRFGDFVVDRQGRKIALTAMIFGRHHKAFDELSHVQVRQNAIGNITLVVTPRDLDVEVERLATNFDMAHLDLEWDIEIVHAPIRSSSGKIKLKL